MNAYKPPFKRSLSTKSDYYSRTCDYLLRCHPDAEPSSVLALCGQAIGQLRQDYRDLPLRKVVMDYADIRTQAAYLFAYTGHHAGQLQRAMLHLGVGIAKQPDNHATRAVCLAAGPGSELLGLSFAMRHAASVGERVKLRACLVDKHAHSWRYGRAAVEYHLQHPDHQKVAEWTGVSYEGWNLATEPMPRRVAEEIACADLITCMNVLTEITAAGENAAQCYRSNMEQVITTMKVGASLLCSDYAGYAPSIELLNAIRGSAQRSGLCVTEVKATDEPSRFAVITDRRVRAAFNTANAIPRKHMRTASLLIRKI